MNKFNKLKQAFTIAEILIVMGIIGIVAEMTIPTLVASYQEKVLLTQFKETYAQLSQAYIMAAKENGTADAWTSTQDAYDNIKSFFLIQEDCPQIAGCFISTTPYNDIKGTATTLNPYGRTTGFYKFTLKTGAAFMFNAKDSVFVDTNGKNGPNQYGYDLFNLVLNNKNGAPYISAVPGLDIAGYCRKIGAPKDSNWTNGGSCAGWLIRKDNFDYLHRDIPDSEWGP